MHTEELLLFAADTARLMLESGGETYRAEECAISIITSQGGAEAECFATATGLMLSFVSDDGKTHTVVRRIKKRIMNLEKVYRIDRMVRDLKTDQIGFEEAESELDRIERLPERSGKTRIAAGAFGAAFFALLFRADVREAFAAFFIGAFVALVVRLSARLRMPDFIANLAGGALAAFCTLLLVQVGLLYRADVTIIGVIMLLVPGVAITNAIRDTIAGDFVAGLARGAEAFLAAAAISAGTGGAFALWQILQPFFGKGA